MLIWISFSLPVDVLIFQFAGQVKRVLPILPLICYKPKEERKWEIVQHMAAMQGVLSSVFDTIFAG
jgi:hypothetical protein